MYRFAVVLATAALALAAPATAQAPVARLAPGHEIMIVIGERITVGPPAPATPLAHDAEALRRLAALPTPDKPVPEALVMPPDDMPRPQVVPGQVAVRMFAGGDRATLLTIENGYASALLYRARLRVGARESATDVCLVPPGKRGYEHWPFRIDALALSDFTLVPWQAGDAIPCA